MPEESKNRDKYLDEFLGIEEVEEEEDDGDPNCPYSWASLEKDGITREMIEKVKREQCSAESLKKAIPGQIWIANMKSLGYKHSEDKIRPVLTLPYGESIVGARREGHYRVAPFTTRYPNLPEGYMLLDIPEDMNDLRKGTKKSFLDINEHKVVTTPMLLTYVSTVDEKTLESASEISQFLLMPGKKKYPEILRYHSNIVSPYARSMRILNSYTGERRVMLKKDRALLNALTEKFPPKIYYGFKYLTLNKEFSQYVLDSMFMMEERNKDVILWEYHINTFCDAGDLVYKLIKRHDIFPRKENDLLPLAQKYLNAIQIDL